MSKSLLRFFAVIILVLSAIQTSSVVAASPSYGQGLGSYFKENDVESTSITKKEPSLIDRIINILMQLISAGKETGSDQKSMGTTR